MATPQASIDLGTNTCLLLVKSGDSILHDESTVVRLGQGVDKTGMLDSEAIDRALKCLNRYSAVAKKIGINPAEILAVGTAQARDAKNAKTFFSRVEAETGIKFRILSGDEEARATFLGAALAGMDSQKMVVMDIGGGSTEIVSLLSGKSLNIGAVRMTERFLKSDPVTDEEFWECEKAIDLALEEMIVWRQTLKIDCPQFVAVAGTAVTLAMLQNGISEYKRELIDGAVLSRGDIHRLVEELKWRTIDERKKMPGMEAKRADVMLAGALIFWRTLERLDFAEAVISTRGLRYGVFLIK